MATNEKGTKLVWQAAQEISRVLAAMIALITGLWFFGEAMAERYVTSVIKAQNYPSQTEIVVMKHDIQELQDNDKLLRDEQTSIGRVLEHQGTQIDSIESLAKEQRALSNTILLELRKP